MIIPTAKALHLSIYPSFFRAFPHWAEPSSASRLALSPWEARSQPCASESPVPWSQSISLSRETNNLSRESNTLVFPQMSLHHGRSQDPRKEGCGSAPGTWITPLRDIPRARRARHLGPRPFVHDDGDDVVSAMTRDLLYIKRVHILIDDVRYVCAWQPRELLLTFVRASDSAAILRRDSKAGCAMTSFGMFRPASTATNAGCESSKLQIVLCALGCVPLRDRKPHRSRRRHTRRKW